jgi:sulfite reductase (NADPH) hemoprotein beta-component
MTTDVDIRSRASFANDAEIDEFVETLRKFERGEISADQWRVFRLVRGTYGQRQPTDAQMVRVKVPQGILTVSALEALADVADQYARGFAHLTTRQNLQFHFVKLHDVEPAMRRFADAGLTTREACGNSVRNITCCPYAGVAHDELFDVTPYSEALTRYLLRHPLSAVLPRKFKIAFEGCPTDHIATAINDIGFMARVEQFEIGLRRGFRITVAGGTSTLARAGQTLLDFCPAEEILDAAEAIIRVYHRLGDFAHRQRNRLKFLVRSLGWERFQAEFQTEFASLRGSARLPFDPEQPPIEAAPAWPRPAVPGVAVVAERAAATAVRGPGVLPRVRPSLVVHAEGFRRWRSTNVRPQKQAGYSIATIATRLGDLTSAQLRLLGDLAVALGDGTLRATMEQNLVFRWIPSPQLPALYERLAAADLARDGAETPADVVSCPGAESCRLAVTQSRGLGRLLADTLDARTDLVEKLRSLDVRISGCPNGCGQHHIAGIGFQGSLRKIDGRPAPHYFVLIGGGTADGVTTFGRVAATVPARRCVEAIERLAALYESQRLPGESARTFFRRVDLAAAKAALAPIERLTAESATPDDFIDLGDEAAFRPEVMDGECSA